MIKLTSVGDFKKTRDFANRMVNGDIFANLDTYGRAGVDALAQATPMDTGLTASSWGYRVIKDKNRPGIEWYNSNTAGGTPVVILLQYGHGTGTGGYVSGTDFINPAIRPIFNTIAEDVWREVTS